MVVQHGRSNCNCLGGEKSIANYYMFHPHIGLSSQRCGYETYFWLRSSVDYIFGKSEMRPTHFFFGHDSGWFDRSHFKLKRWSCRGEICAVFVMNGRASPTHHMWLTECLTYWWCDGRYLLCQTEPLTRPHNRHISLWGHQGRFQTCIPLSEILDKARRRRRRRRNKGKAEGHKERRKVRGKERLDVRTNEASNENKNKKRTIYEQTNKRASKKQTKQHEQQVNNPTSQTKEHTNIISTQI